MWMQHAYGWVVLTAMHCTGSCRGLGNIVWNLGPGPDPADALEGPEVEEEVEVEDCKRGK